MAEALVGRVVRAALDARLEGRRDAILASLGDWSNRLPQIAIPRDQLTSDIRYLANQWPVDGRHPLSEWLVSAAMIAREAGRPNAGQLDALGAEVDASPLTGPLTQPQWESRYRAELAEHGRRLASIGLPTPPRWVDFDELFVDFTVRFGPEDWIPCTDLTDKLVPGACLVLVGDAGVGKTTICRALIRSVCAEPSRLPLWVRLRAWDPTMDLLDWLAHRSPDVRIDRAHAESVLSDGRGALFLDGFDEVARAPDRQRLSSWLQAIRSRWPRAITVVTTRPDVYDEGLLPGTQVLVSILSRAERERLIERWCAAIHLESREKADAMATAIVDRLDRSEPVAVMADTPLMVTLVVLVHLIHGDLPTKQHRLVDQCVDALLETWPASRGDASPLDDPDTSRAAVERLALSLAYPDDAEPALGAPLATIHELAEQALSAEGMRGRSLARRWVEHLIRACGLFHRTSEGWVEFAHRVFADALVAGAVDRLHAGRVVEWIVDHAGPYSGAAVDLLLSRPRDRTFLDRLRAAIIALLGEDGVDRGVELIRKSLAADVPWTTDDWSALHDCAFDLGVQAAIADLDGPDRTRRQKGWTFITNADWPEGAKPLADWVSEHPPTREALERRVREAVSHAVGERLLGAVAWGLHVQWVPEPETIIRERADRSRALEDCARLWPAAFVGWMPVESDKESERKRLTRRRSGLHDEVAAAFSARSALDRFDSVVDDDLLAMAVAALRDDALSDAALGALSVRIAESALRLGCCDAAGAARLLGPPPETLVGVPSYLAARVDEEPVMTRPRRPPFAPPSARPSGPYPDTEELRCLIDFDEPSLGRSRLLVRRIGTTPPRASEHLLADLPKGPIDPESIQSRVPWGWSTLLIMMIASGAPTVPVAFWADEAKPRELEPAVAFPTSQPGASRAPTTPAQPSSRHGLVRAFDDPTRCVAAWHRLARQWLLDAHVAGAYHHVVDDSDLKGAFGHRLRSLNTIEVWSWFDRLFIHAAGRDNGVVKPGLHALYLVLGWSAHTTTGRWPEGAIWSHIFQGEPLHWLPRAHWYLCWLAHRPDDPQRRDIFMALVQAGRADPQMGALAERMVTWAPAHGLSHEFR